MKLSSRAVKAKEVVRRIIFLKEKKNRGKKKTNIEGRMIRKNSKLFFMGQRDDDVKLVVVTLAK